MTRLWKGANYTLVNNKYKISINTTLQPTIKILNKCSCVSKDTKWVPSPLRFVAFWSSYCLKCVFLRKSRDPPLCFPEPWFGFPSLVRMHAATLTYLFKTFDIINAAASKFHMGKLTSLTNILMAKWEKRCWKVLMSLFFQKCLSLDKSFCFLLKQWKSVHTLQKIYWNIY